MPYFFYTAINQQGEIIKSDGEFVSPTALFTDLQHRRMDLITYRKSIFSFIHFNKKIKRLILAEFFNNLSLLLTGGISLNEAIKDLLATSEDKQLKKVFTKISYQMEDGKLMSEALEDHKKSIPTILTTLISIGEETGSLDKTMKDGAKHLERIEEIISTTQRALIYPSFIIVAMSGAFIFWMVYVLPQLLNLFTEMGVEEIPFTTQLLIYSVEIFNNWWFVIPFFILALISTWTISRKYETLKLRWDTIMLKIPVIGTIIHYSQLAFFFEYTSMLTGAGINILRSLDLMHKSVQNEVLKHSISVIRKKVSGGESLSDAITPLPFFEPFTLRMVHVGEITGNMPEQMQILAEHYMTKVNNMVETISKTIEPIIIGVAGVMFLIIILGLLGPVYDLIATIN